MWAVNSFRSRPNWKSFLWTLWRGWRGIRSRRRPRTGRTGSRSVRRRLTGSFDYAPLRVNRCGYTYAGRCDKVHIMMMKACGMYVDGLVVMHGDNNKENNRLSNLKMGTKEDNAWRQHAVQIHIRHANGTVPTTYRSECEAARCTGISLTTIHRNRKRQRPGSPLVFTTSRGRVFAATDPPQPETVPV